METQATLPHVRQRTTSLASLQGAAWRRAEFVHRLLLLSAMAPAVDAPAPGYRRLANDRAADERPRDDGPKS